MQGVNAPAAVDELVPDPAIPRSDIIAAKARGIQSAACYVLQKYDLLEKSRARVLAGRFQSQADLDAADRRVNFDELALSCAIGLLRAECGYPSPQVPKEQS